MIFYIRQYNRIQGIHSFILLLFSQCMCISYISAHTLGLGELGLEFVFQDGQLLHVDAAATAHNHQQGARESRQAAFFL